MDRQATGSARNEGSVKQWAVKQAIFLFFLAVLLFVSSGRLVWSAGWIYLAVVAFVGVTMAVALLRYCPDLLEERSQVGEGTKRWDKGLAFFTALSPALMGVTAGLEERFSPGSPITAGPLAAGLAAAILGSELTLWAMTTNRFFSGVVRIQKERGHEPVSGGPYAYVRHPGYVGALAFTLATPLILGSSWTSVTAGATVVVLVIRTALEDRTLKNELAGYREYAERVRYRLLPFVW